MQASPSQTVGPFFLQALIHHGDENMAKGGTAGLPVIIEGSVFDARGDLVNDAMLEVFQADADGNFVVDSVAARAGGAFTGYGRATPDESGKFRFTTIYPGSVASPAGNAAPHLELMVFARGLLKPLVTRIYFAGDAGNADDPVLALVPAARRHTLEASLQVGSTPAVWRFDVRLQGEGETVFFDF
jgi:protocatechuate 3,4-dioxygenase alpha subunit